MSKDITKDENVQEKKKMKVILRPISNFKLPKGARGNLEVQGRRFAVFRWSERPHYVACRKLNKYEYLVCSSGEIRNYQPKEDKNIQSLKHTFERLRGLIRTNFTDGEQNQIHVTLTFDTEVRDNKELYKHFNLFMKRLRHHYYWHTLEYIVVMEPHASGVWHCHLLLKSVNQDALYIKQDVLTTIWRNGRVWINRVTAKDIASYYIAYFTDIIDVSDSASDVDAEQRKDPATISKATDEYIASLSPEERSKRRIKGARLHYYPKGFKFYRTSRGIKKPILVKDIARETVIKRGYGEPVYEGAVEMVKVEDEQAEPNSSDVHIDVMHRSTFQRTTLLPKDMTEDLTRMVVKGKAKRRLRLLTDDEKENPFIAIEPFEYG